MVVAGSATAGQLGWVCQGGRARDTLFLFGLHTLGNIALGVDGTYLVVVASQHQLQQKQETELCSFYLQSTEDVAYLHSQHSRNNVWWAESVCVVCEDEPAGLAVQLNIHGVHLTRTLETPQGCRICWDLADITVRVQLQFLPSIGYPAPISGFTVPLHSHLSNHLSTEHPCIQPCQPITLIPCSQPATMINTGHVGGARKPDYHRPCTSFNAKPSKKTITHLSTLAAPPRSRGLSRQKCQGLRQMHSSESKPGIYK